MVYNEAEYLPVWLRHHARQVGAAHCHVIDHGSTDGSTEGLRSVLRLPRSAHDDARRADFVSEYCAALLRWYDAVLFSDVDELVVLPCAAGGLDLSALPEVTYAAGFNVLHVAEEGPLDLARSIGTQRRWAWFASAMCKPVLIRRRVCWAPGFHSVDAPMALGGLTLFHLRYADRAIALRRLARTRVMPWANAAGGEHQRVSDAEFCAMLDRLERMDRVAGGFDAGAAPLRDWLARVADSQAGREAARYRIALDIENYQLWEIPEALRAALGQVSEPGPGPGPGLSSPETVSPAPTP
jgi:hypothetical protein